MLTWYYERFSTHENAEIFYIEFLIGRVAKCGSCTVQINYVSVPKKGYFSPWTVTKSVHEPISTTMV